jgi:hypothetical protein
MSSFDSRQKYLAELGLLYDPFQAAVAEQDFKLSLEVSRQIPEFYSYFAMPILRKDDGGALTLFNLRDSYHTVVYGFPGDGKTTLRYNLDASCRTLLDQTLVTNYIFGEDIAYPLSANEHGERLAHHMALEIFIQILEQINQAHPVTTEQSETLSLLMSMGNQRLKRLVKIILANPSPSSFAGIAAYWPIVGKNAVRYVSASPALLKILAQALEAAPPVEKPHGWEAVRILWQAAQAWGFKRLIVLVDGVDTRNRNETAMWSLLQPLFERLDELAQQHIYLKLFLPMEIEQHIDRWCIVNTPLHSFPVKVRIIWSEDAIEKVLVRRFEAAGARVASINQLAGSNFEDLLEPKLIGVAHNSPRRALEWFSTLIDAHVINHRKQLEIDQADWELAQEMRQSYPGG